MRVNGRGLGWGLLLVVGLLAPAWQAGAAQAAGPGERLARLDAGVRAAEAVRAVKRLQNSHAHFIDAGLWAEAAALFTADGTFESGGKVVRGQQALRRHFMQQAGRGSQGLDEGQLHTHLLMQPIITLGADGRTAKGTWHELSMRGRFGRHATWAGGIYENEYVLEQGTWKISRMRFFPQYEGDFDAYGHKAPPRWDVPYHFEARHVGVTIPEAAIDALSRDAAAGADPAQLGARLARLADETAVLNLQHAFGYYLDRKMYEDIADLFTAGGTFEARPQGVYVGPARIRAALASLYGAPPLNRGELFDHILTGTVVTIGGDGRTAAARSTQLAMLGRGGEWARWELGVFENRFVKEDGRWKLAAVQYTPRMITDYDVGWAHDAHAAPPPSATLPPDRRPGRFAMYPARQFVEFHFVHPVTGRPIASPGGVVLPTELLRDGTGGRGRMAAQSADGGAADLVALERMLHAAIAVDAVENLNSSYGYYLDESDWDGMADTYASRGAKEITGAGVYVGPERIRRILKLRGPTGGRTPDFFTIHQLTQPVIHISEDGLSANARLRLFQDGGSADGSSGSWIGGIYENTAYFENGEWKFGIQDLHHIFNASYRNGWARVGPFAGQLAGRAPSPRDERGGGIAQGLGGARGGTRLADEMPPDRPIRARQYSFPDISEPAFHYVNPVSGRKPEHFLVH
ncbi:MAG: nuclear transport factor 2 family protein [Pseudomonadota bacterium]|jgi:hypothetical protein|nr:MAG: hypothetical protein DIU62_01855 [Pseudomonadota bacterium]